MTDHLDAMRAAAQGSVDVHLRTPVRRRIDVVLDDKNRCPEHGAEPTWTDCRTCHGDGSIRDTADLDVTCPDCDGDGGWER